MQSIKRRTIKRRTIKRRNVKRRSIKRRATQRRKRTNRRRIYGGAATENNADLKTASNPTPGNPPSSVSATVSANNQAQNERNHQLSGGHKHSKHKHSKHKHSKHGGRRQRGGGVIHCAGAVVNSLDGWGYLAPPGCIQVPTVSNPDIQQLVTSVTNTSIVQQEQGSNDAKAGP